MSQYDLIILGGGPGGYNAAIRAGQLGMKVACVEGRETLGGTCLNVGCIPSKALLHASEAFEQISSGAYARMGIDGAATLNLDHMQQHKAEGVAGLTKGIEFLFRKNKVDWIKGWGRLDGKGRVQVSTADGTHTLLQAKDIIIATGSVPTPLPGVPVDNLRILDSTGALSLSEVPGHLVVIGAGVIGLELGSVWRRLGAKVTVVEYLDQVCPGMDEETAKAFQRTLVKQGMHFKMGHKVVSASTAATQVALTLQPREGGEHSVIEADYVLVAIGRKPFTEGLNLESVGLVPGERGVLGHNGHYQSPVEGVWVIGDVTTGPMLAHKAEDEAIACVERIHGKAAEVNYEALPSVIYTRPEVASAGSTEQQLRAAGRAYTVGRFPFSANSRAKVNGEGEGFVKVLADAHTDRILGVHMIGPGVSEMIGEYCVALEFGASSEDIALTCHPHPTRSEALRQAAMDVAGWTTQI